MNVDINNLSVLAYTRDFTLWHYKAETTLAESCSRGFFDDAGHMMAAGDMVLISAKDGGKVLFVADGPGTVCMVVEAPSEYNSGYRSSITARKEHKERAEHAFLQSALALADERINGGQNAEILRAIWRDFDRDFVALEMARGACAQTQRAAATSAIERLAQQRRAEPVDEVKTRAQQQTRAPTSPIANEPET